MRILIVDDEPMVARATSRLLHRDHHVDVAHSPEDAFEAVRRQSYEVVISDVDLPGMLGPEVCQEILRLQQPAPRFVFYTGRVTWKPPSDLAKLGVVVLFKPCSKEELLEAIRCT